MNMKLMLCQYPENGFGAKKGQYYLMNQLGHRFDFTNEYDRVLDERFYHIELPGMGEFNGETVDEIIEDIKLHDVDVCKW